MRFASARGVALVELLLATGLAVVVLAATLPGLMAGRARAEVLAATRYVAARSEALRLEAVVSGRSVGLRFETVGDDVEVTAFADGNGNGLRAADIAEGIDAAVEGPFRLGDLFPGAQPGQVADDGSRTEGVRFGQAGLVSFSPRGTSTSGSLYLTGRGQWQFAMRVLGATGRVRLEERHPGTGRWQEVR